MGSTALSFCLAFEEPVYFIRGVGFGQRVNERHFGAGDDTAFGGPIGPEF